jgi:glucose-1-phosphate adenylyltransferase
MHKTACFILGGGRGAGLYPLTRFRSAPAVSVAGKYRLIDIPLSNCINSGLRRIYVLTQFLSVSLHRHIANTYSFAPFSRGFVQVLAAQQTNEGADWYQGTADALRQNLRYMDAGSGDILILSGDGLYRMNYAELLARHRANNADLTIASVRVPRERASLYGILRTGPDGSVLELVEKPSSPAVLDGLRLPEGDWLANMGIYVCKREFLVGLLQGRPTAHDLVTELFAASLRTHRVRTDRFEGYWHDLGSSIGAYHEAHLALASRTPPFDFYSAEGVIYTHMRNLPASRVDGGEVSDSLISDGCVLGPGSRVARSVVGQRLPVGPNAELTETVLCGANQFETAEVRKANRPAGVPDIGVGAGSVLRRVIADKDCRIGAGVRIANEKGLRHHDGDGYFIRDGIVVLPRGAVVPDGTVI